MTFVPINDLSRWDSSEVKNINQRIQEVVSSGHFMLGPNTTRLEAILGERLGGMNVVCVGNGTDALVVSLLGLGISVGDKVATVANAGGYATGAILRIGAIPILIDVEQDSAQMSVDHLTATLSNNNIRAVVVTHLYGLMADIASLSRIAAENGVLLIEDCAQAIGATINGHEAGSWGDAATFSFYPTKNLGCLGDGGAVAFRDSKTYELGKQIAQYGWSDRYVISEQNGFNTRLDEIQAAVLLERLQSLDANNARRRAIVRRYARVLPTGYRLIWKDDSSYVGHLAILVGTSRSHIQKTLTDHHIGHGIHYPLTDNQQPAWQNIFASVSVPQSEALAEQIVTLPCFPAMSEQEIEQVCSALVAL
jgi:dTDP-4-amino-4,6-dideoxygalactose transaminase